MKRVRLSPFVLLLGPAWVAGAEPVDYLRDVRPIFEQRCYKCHGSDQQRGMLRLDTALLIREGGESGPAIVPGQAGESLLIQAVSGAIDDWRMPPEEGGRPLSEAQIDILRRWVEQGAHAPDEPQPDPPSKPWSYEPPRAGAVPRTRDATWSENPIDAFIAARHEELGLAPNPEADRATLLRRIYLDLIGLPPTPRQLQAFLDDTGELAYEKVVDDLLASPRYGERWGRHWMDIWRYSDWYGYGAELRNSQRHMWRWRDWIIESLNAGKGYDRMILEMLAGDELSPLDPHTLRATGFLARNWYRYNRDTWLNDTVEHTSKAFLGITMNCARCHEHKYDPISHRDYYRFRAFFEPHGVTTWRLPGQPDTDADGVAHVHDAQPDRVTYRLIRGDEKQPDKSRIIEPGLPKALTFGELVIEPVSLPAEAYYPGLRPYVRKEVLAAAEAEFVASQQAVATARAALEAAHQAVASSAPPPPAAGDSAMPASPPQDPPTAPPGPPQETAEQAAWRLADSRRAAASAQVLALRARIAADDAVFGRADANVEPLKLIAAAAERQAASREAEYAWARAEHALGEARAAAKDGDAKSLAAVTAAEKKAVESRQALDKAREGLGRNDAKYSPLTEVHPATSTGRRLALARWITDHRNPLTARVAVNHIWLRHFGRPLVETVFDLGPAGARPTHPQLLDYLAVRFMDDGWSMKKLHRLIVTSRTYRMSSGAGPAQAANAGIDPDNRHLWRQNIRRAEAEIVRDSLLAVGGRLDLTMGGPELDHQQALATHRRSIYYRTAPEKQAMFFMTFNAASPIECYRRDESIVPQQALAMVNSPLTFEQSRLLAAQIGGQVAEMDEAHRDTAFIDQAFQRILGRAPSVQESAACAEFLQHHPALLADSQGLTAFDGTAGPNVAAAQAPAQRARENLIHVLMNHNDFVTIR